MAAQPDLVGTVTLTSGQVGFTVAGINMVAADVLAGEQILLPAKGLVLTIGSRTNATTGALSDPCPAAAAGAAQPCRIRFQSDLARVAAQARNLIDLIGSGNVEALSGLVLAANKGIHATGPNTLATHDLTLAGRQLLAGASMSDIRNILEAIGNLRSAQLLTSSGTWNRPTGCKGYLAIMRGGGGGGGGALASAGQAAAGGGGQQGELAVALNLAPAATHAYSIGAGGAGGVGNAFGGTGGNTTIGGITASGGIGGTWTGSAIAAASYYRSLGSSGAGAALLRLLGETGDPAMRIGVATNQQSGGAGGGAGGGVTVTAQGNGGAGSMGGGGGGAISRDNGGSQSGGAGGDGFILMLEFY